jgi:hypothetical protein
MTLKSQSTSVARKVTSRGVLASVAVCREFTDKILSLEAPFTSATALEVRLGPDQKLDLNPFITKNMPNLMELVLSCSSDGEHL